MFKVIDGNDTGKTRKLLMECSDHNGLFVCNHPERVKEKCIAYNINPIPESIGYNDLIYYDGRKPVYVDELEKLITYILPNVEGYTLTKD